MNAGLRERIRQAHRWLDGLAGRLISRQEPLDRQAGSLPKRPRVDSFSDFLYSRREHFRCFDLLPVYRQQTPASCDLKVYQDLLAYTFIRTNLKPGSRLLEIGGGESRVLATLANDYETWNLDKLEGVGFGPRAVREGTGQVLVRDYIGNFNRELPDGSFDLVFSISTVEHFSEDAEDVTRILADIQRLLKPGGHSLHCIDGRLFADHVHVHPFLAQSAREVKGVRGGVDFERIREDAGLWLLPAFAYYTRWYPLTRKRLSEFGHPFSVNVLWTR